MKKILTMIVAIAMLAMMVMPASAADNFKLTVEGADIAVGATTATVVVKLETTEKLMDGGVFISYPTDKLELILPEESDDIDDPLGTITEMDNAEVGIENNQLKVAFMNSKGIKAGTHTIATLNFKVKDSSAAEKIDITVTIDRLMAKGDSDVGNALVDDDNPAAPVVGSVNVVAAPSTTEAPTTTTAPNAPTGEATPWALMATVAVAGAALVVLSTKKSK